MVTTIENFKIILSNFNNMYILLFLSLLTSLVLYKSKKYKPLYTCPLIIILCLIVYPSCFFYSNIKDVNTYNEYNNLKNYEKYYNRIQDNKKVFYLQDTHFNNIDEQGLLKGKKSSIEHLYFLTSFNNYTDDNKILMPSVFYYHLCLFYSNSSCQNFGYGKIIKLKTKNLRQEALNIKQLPWYLKYYPKVNNKEDSILLNNEKGKDFNVDNFSCTLLFYGAQNGWKKYRDKLIEKLKENKSCKENIFKEIGVTRDVPGSNEILISFLTNIKDEDDLDFEFENGIISLKKLYEKSKKDNESIYNDLLLFFYENKSLKENETMIVHLNNIRKISNLSNLIDSENKKENLIKIINKIKMPQQNVWDNNSKNLSPGDLKLIDEKYELLKELNSIN